MNIETQFESIDACRFCFMCRHVCTMGLATGWESDTPRGRALMLFKVFRGFAKYNDDIVRSMYRSSLSGICESWCKGGYKPTEAVLAARKDIVELGIEPEGARRIKENIIETGNPFGLPAGDRFKAVENLGGAATEPDAEALYYVGCDTAYLRPEIATAFLRLLSRSGIGFKLLEEETSSGKPLTVLGYGGEAKQVAETLAAKISATGCRVVVTTCPSSYDAFKNDYPAMGIDLDGIEVLHASEYLGRLVSEGKLTPRKSLDRTVTVLDSDRLGRFNGLYDEPRNLLRTIPGAALEEMAWTRDLAHSCAETGGVLRQIYPGLIPPLAERVLAEARSTGAQVLATSCPVTKQTLLEAGERDIAIQDIVELVAESVD